MIAEGLVFLCFLTAETKMLFVRTKCAFRFNKMRISFPQYAHYGFRSEIVPVFLPLHCVCAKAKSLFKLKKGISIGYMVFALYFCNNIRIVS